MLANAPAPAPAKRARKRRATANEARATESALATTRARQVRALVPCAPHAESAELKARRVSGQESASGAQSCAPLGKAGQTKAGHAARAQAIAARVYAEMKRDTAHAFPLSAGSVLAGGRVIAMREGESARAVRARLAQPSGDNEARAIRARAVALAPHLSQRERNALDALTLSRMNARRALSDAMASIESGESETREAWTIDARFSPRECVVLAKLRAARRKRAARAQWNAKDKAARHNARKYLLRRARLARALRIERACDAMAGACAGQRARFHAFGACVLKEKESGARIGRKAARLIAPASGETTLDAGASGAFEIDARDGTGRPLDAQCIAEMKQAARAGVWPRVSLTWHL